MTVQTLSQSMAANYLSVRVTVSRWSGERSDRSAAADLTTAKHATAGSARVIKNLLPGADLELKTARSSYGQLRDYVRRLTLPYGDSDGRGNIRLLAAADSIPFLQGYRELQDAAKADLDTFLAVYPQRVQTGMAALSGMADIADYPDEAEIREKFGSNLKIDPIAEDGDFSRASIPAKLAEHLAARRAEQATESAATALTELHTRALTGLESMAKQLTSAAAGDRAILGARLYDNLNSVASMLVSHNILGDDRLVTLAADIKALTLITPDEVRATTTAAKHAAGLANSALAQLAAVAGEAPPPPSTPAPVLTPTPAPEPIVPPADDMSVLDAVPEPAAETLDDIFAEVEDMFGFDDEEDDDELTQEEAAPAVEEEEPAPAPTPAPGTTDDSVADTGGDEGAHSDTDVAEEDSDADDSFWF